MEKKLMNENVNLVFNKTECVDGCFKPNADRYSKSLSEIIKCKTISEPYFFNRAEIDKLHSYIRVRYPLLVAACKWTDFDGGVMLCWEGKQHDNPLILMSHMDVALVNGDWDKPAFSGEISDGAVWGRGAVDTKGSLCAIFEAAESLLSEGYLPERDVYILSSSKEEIAGDDAVHMAKWFTENNIKPKLVIDEGGGIVDAPIGGIFGKFAMIGMIERSSARLIIEAKSDKSSTAQEKLASFVLNMKGQGLGKRDFSPETLAMFKAMVPNAKGIMKFVLKNMKIFKPIMLKLLPKLNSAAGSMLGTTLSFSSAKDDELRDMLNRRGRMAVNISGNYYYPIDNAINEFKLIAENQGLVVKVISKRETPRPEPLNSNGFKFVGDLAVSVFDGVTPSPFSVLGGTDARHFVGVSESVIRFAPIYLNKQQFGSFHNLNENLNIESLVGAVKFYREAIKRFK
ncbi:MAG: M20/M25/M40 family metallo-hydrolase [Clostridia bacterium]